MDFYEEKFANLNNFHNTIHDELFEDNDKELLLDHYNLNETCYNFLVNKKKDYVQYLKNTILSKINKNIEISRIYEFYKNIIPIDILNYIFKYEQKNNIEFTEILLSKNTEHIKEIQLTKEEIEKLSKFEGCRDNQYNSIKMSLLQYFKSGIDYQATGAGKTNIILAKADRYRQLYNKGVILMCERIDILTKVIKMERDIVIKQKNIINFDNFTLINCVSENEFNIDIVNSSEKPCFLIINRAFLTSNNKYLLLPKNKFGLVLYDECHSNTAVITFNMLMYFKTINNWNIIGFSATPIRRDKYDKVLSLYGENNTLNIISNYNMINAICDNICLPIKYYVIPVNKKANIESYYDIINSSISQILKECPYKKILGWCATINECDKIYDKFMDWQKITYTEFKIYKSHSDFSESPTHEMSFYEAENYSIMICVDQYREGSAIKNLDCGIYLDFVKDKGEIPLIQTCGRVIRPDPNGLKKYGIMIHFPIVISKNDLFEKIINYFMFMISISEIDKLNHIDKLINIKNNIDIDKLTKTIKIQLDNNNNHDMILQINDNMNIFGKTLDWNKFKNEFKTYIETNYEKKFLMLSISKLSYINFNNTVLNKKKIGDNIIDDIDKHRLWGIKNESVYSKIATNEYILFIQSYPCNKIHIYKIIKKYKNKQISVKLWNNETYEYIFVIEYVNSDNIAKKEIMKKLGYSEKFNLQGIIIYNKTNQYLQNLTNYLV